MSGFKLINIEVKDNDFLDNVNLKFVNLNETNSGPYFSIIIGQNGTGKSNILRLIINLFRDINHYRKHYSFSGNVPKRFGIRYSIDDKDYVYSNFFRGDNLDAKILTGEHEKKYYQESSTSRLEEIDFKTLDKESLRDIDVVLPKRILASSIMLTDKYPIINKIKEPFDEYEYLGVRRLNSPGTAGTQTYINRTVEYIADSLKKPKFKDKVKEVLKFLNLEEKFIIQFTPRYRNKLFNGNLDLNKLNGFFLNKEGLKRETELWGKKYYEKMTETEIVSLIEFCNNLFLQSKIVKPYEGAFTRVIEYDIIGNSSLNEDYDKIEHLRKLDLLSYPYFKISKKGKEIDAEESSSGEAHFISSLVSVIATIEDNSLILIDEPEISLHPNWQMKYIHFLNHIFKEYRGCHFIICTHSHFLISDLMARNSNIVGLQRDSELRVLDLKSENTFGWSAEEVLLKIFQVPTTRNYFVAEKLGEVLDLVSVPKEERNTTLIREKVKELISYNLHKLSTEDPLHDVIRKLIIQYAAN